MQSPHAALLAQGSAIIAVHALETQRQSLQLPAVGPVLLPVWHVEDPAHQPHAERRVQSPHALLVLHASPPEARQSLAYHRQSPQLPESGPRELPCWQPPPDPHQPQVARAVHAPQSAASVQGSLTGAWHVPLVQLRPAQQSASVVHLPLPD